MKIKFFALLSILAVLFSACGAADEYAIENHEWELATVQGGSNGAVLYCSPEQQGFYPDAQVIDTACQVKNGTLTITTADETWKLSCELIDRGVESDLYKIGSDGYASVALTTYTDGTSVYTLVISYGGYGLYFYET